MTKYLDIVVLLGLLSIAVWTDLARHKISNLLVLTVIVAGILIQGVLHGIDGLTTAFTGLLVGFVVFLFPYAKGGMAAGDVKLMAAIGTFLGPQWVLVASCIACVVGATIGGGLIAYQQYRTNALTAEKLLTTRFPFAAAITVGVASSLVIRGTL